MKSSREKGLEFELEVYKFLKKKYKGVESTSWLSPYDFSCIDENKNKVYVEARLNNAKTPVRPIVNLVATKKKGIIVLLDAVTYPKKTGTLTQIDFEEKEEKIIEGVSKKFRLNKPKSVKKIISEYKEIKE